MKTTQTSSETTVRLSIDLLINVLINIILYTILITHSKSNRCYEKVITYQYCLICLQIYVLKVNMLCIQIQPSAGIVLVYGSNADCDLESMPDLSLFHIT